MIYNWIIEQAYYLWARKTGRVAREAAAVKARRRGGRAGTERRPYEGNGPVAALETTGAMTEI